MRMGDQRSVSGTLSNLKHGIFYIRYFENGPLEPRYQKTGSWRQIVDKNKNEGKIAFSRTKHNFYLLPPYSLLSHFYRFLSTATTTTTFLLFSLHRRHYQIFNGGLKHRRRRRQWERQKSNRFRLAEQQLCTWSRFLYISLPSLHDYDYDVKIPNFTFCGGREHKTTTFFFYSWTLIQS